MSQSEFFTTAGRRLTEAQLNRRRFMQGLLASGAVATIAGLQHPSRAFAQAATPTTEDWTPYNGELAADQVMRLATTEPTTMDPGVSYGDDELDIFFNIFDGLVGVDQRTGQVVPRVAESWDTNAEASEYTFHIRQGVTWSDGTPLNANDFLYAWSRVLDPNTASQYIPALYPIKNAEKIANGELTIDQFGVQVVDDNTLKVTLEGPTTYFPLLASTWTFYPVPKHVVDAKGNEWVEAGNIVSNGPFVMTEWTHDQQIVLEPNAAYYGDKPTLTRAEYLIYEDTGTKSYTPFENDELDYALPEGPDLDRALADPDLSKDIVTFERSNCYFVVCDTTNAPTDKVEFRQALSKSIDRKTLAETVLNNQYEAAPTLLPKNIPGNNPDAGLGESLDEAKQLLTAAGVDPSSVKLDLTFIGNDSFYSTLVQYLQSTWQQNLGITINLAPLADSNAYSDWRASRETQPFNIYTATWGSDFADASNWMNQNFTHAADHYRNHWNYPEFDQLVGQALTNLNTEERNQQYAQSEKILLEQAPIIPVVHGKSFRAVKPWVKDIFFQPVLSVVHLRTIKIAAH
ncbi:MAG TPA: peptide ABC transporter substrate-binding protein [Thermomicrobiales bacterium]